MTAAKVVKWGTQQRVLCPHCKIIAGVAETVTCSRCKRVYRKSDDGIYQEVCDDGPA